MSIGWNSRVRCEHCGLMGSKQRGRVTLHQEPKFHGPVEFKLHYLHARCAQAFRDATSLPNVRVPIPEEN